MITMRRKCGPQLLARMAEGQALALVSDAGSPLLSDPGYKLVQAAVEAGIAVTAIPGASAVLDALTLSALPPDRFMFCGFLPNRSGARRHFLEELKTIEATLVMFDTASRGDRQPRDIAAVLGERDVAVGRELTKLHEEVIRGTAAEVREKLAARASIKGEITLVIGPPGAAASTTPQAMVDNALREALETHAGQPCGGRDRQAFRPQQAGGLCAAPRTQRNRLIRAAGAPSATAIGPRPWRSPP